MTKKQKPLQKGEFNWFGEIHVIYRHAKKSEAYQVLTRALAKKLGIIPYAVRLHFDGSKDNFKISEEIKSNKSETFC
jgi:hypothetical protein